MKKNTRLPAILLDRLSYRPPPWITAINGFRKNQPAMFWALAMVLLATVLVTGYTLTDNDQ